jgi:hypothetical protein
VGEKKREKHSLFAMQEMGAKTPTSSVLASDVWERTHVLLLQIKRATDFSDRNMMYLPKTNACLLNHKNWTCGF